MHQKPYKSFQKLYKAGIANASDICNSCVNKVEPILLSNSDIEEYSIDLEHPDKIISINGKDLKSQDLISKFHGIKTKLYK